MKTIRLASAAALAALASPTFAATQGTPGPTSTGTVTINATITPEVTINRLDDITFDATYLLRALNLGGSASTIEQHCVWSNNPDRSFFITASGDGAGNDFTLNDGTRTLQYRVTYRPPVGTPGVLTPGVKSPRYVTTATSADCGGTDVSGLQISISAVDIAAMEATTTYTGVLTLLVSPN